MEKYTVHLAGNAKGCQDLSSPLKWYVDSKQLQSNCRRIFFREIYKILMEMKVKNILNNLQRNEIVGMIQPCFKASAHLCVCLSVHMHASYVTGDTLK